MPAGSGDLAAIVADAYRVFPARSLSDAGVCNCEICMSDAEQRELVTLNRREIPSKLLGKWYGAATGDNGTPRPVSEHLAPRILEGLVRGEDEFGPGQEVALARSAFGDRTVWTGEQADVLESFRIAFIDRFRTEVRWGLHLDDALCMFALGRFEVAPILGQISEWPAADLVNRLWTDWRGVHGSKVWRTPFWGHSPGKDVYISKAAFEALEWYRSQLRNGAIDAVFSDHADDPTLIARAGQLKTAWKVYDQFL